MDIGIITNGRPQALNKLINSLIYYNSNDFHEIFVYNTTPIKYNQILEEYDKILDKNNIKHILLCGYGPGHARNNMFNNAKSEWLLVLDDDLYIDDATTITNLKKYKYYFGDYNIVGGIWKDSKLQRPIWYEFNFNKDILYQIAHFNKNTQSKYIKTDKGYASFIIDLKTIKHGINFDTIYSFYGEMLDFFLLCYENNINTYNILESQFIHDHKEYLINDVKQKRNNKTDDFNKLKHKWNLKEIVNDKK